MPIMPILCVHEKPERQLLPVSVVALYLLEIMDYNIFHFMSSVCFLFMKFASLYTIYTLLKYEYLHSVM